MGQTVRFQKILRRLAMIDESCVEDQAGLALGPAEGSSLDPKTEALLRVGAAAAIGAAPVCLEWSTGRALAAGASEDEIADVLLAIAPVTGLGRIVSAASALSAAELRLLPLLPTHLPLTQIAAELFLSPHTVRTQAKSIYRKLGTPSRSHAVARARQLGLLDG